MSEVRCPWCHDALDTRAPLAACRACAAAHHPACWVEGGACATCGERQALVPGDPLSVASRGSPALRLVAGLTAIPYLAFSLCLASGVIVEATSGRSRWDVLLVWSLVLLVPGLPGLLLLLAALLGLPRVDAGLRAVARLPLRALRRVLGSPSTPDDPTGAERRAIAAKRRALGKPAATPSSAR